MIPVAGGTGAAGSRKITGGASGAGSDLTGADANPDPNNSPEAGAGLLGASMEEAPWDITEEGANDPATGPVTDDYADIINPGTTTLDEEFAGGS